TSQSKCVATGSPIGPGQELTYRCLQQQLEARLGRDSKIGALGGRNAWLPLGVSQGQKDLACFAQQRRTQAGQLAFAGQETVLHQDTGTAGGIIKSFLRLCPCQPEIRRSRMRNEQNAIRRLIRNRSPRASR